MNALLLIFSLLGSTNLGGAARIRAVQDQTVGSTRPNGILHRIHATDARLHYDSMVVCPVVTNPRDGHPDVPEETWKGFVVEPILEKVAKDMQRRKGKAISFLFSSPEGFPFAFSRPILRSMGDGGVKRVFLPLSGERHFPVELYLAKEVRGLVHSGDKTGSHAILILHPDSIVLHVHARSGDGKPNLTIPVANRNRATPSDLERLDSALVRNLSGRDYLSWVGVDPHPMVSFGRVVQILEVVDRINTTRTVPRGINVFLAGVYVPW